MQVGIHLNAHLVAHKIYGVPQTINSANYVYFLAYKELFALRALGDSHSGLDETVNGKNNIIQAEPHTQKTQRNF
jgi:hypothetical protein